MDGDIQVEECPKGNRNRAQRFQHLCIHSFVLTAHYLLIAVTHILSVFMAITGVIPCLRTIYFLFTYQYVFFLSHSHIIS